MPQDHRYQALSQKGITLWMTGYSGSGKSTIARALEEKLVLEYVGPTHTHTHTHTYIYIYALHTRCVHVAHTRRTCTRTHNIKHIHVHTYILPYMYIYIYTTQIQHIYNIYTTHITCTTQIHVY